MPQAVGKTNQQRHTASRYAAFVMFGAEGSNASSSSLRTPAKCRGSAAAPQPQTLPHTQRNTAARSAVQRNRQCLFRERLVGPWTAGEVARMPCSARAQGVCAKP